MDGEVTRAIPAEVRHSRRRTLAIEVRRGPRVVVRAPLGCPSHVIEAWLRERRPWIERHAARLRALEAARPPPPAWAPGETHLYLGEPHRLEVGAGRRAGVARERGALRVTVPAGATGEAGGARVRRALEAWYRARAREEFAALVLARFPFFAGRGHALPTLTVRRMTSRWGSLASEPRRRVAGFFRGPAGAARMTLNLALIRAPPECIEYVVVHELCHLEHRGHGPAFYRLLERQMPDWRARKRRLEDLGLLDGDS
jgi:hypothetical protein